MTDFEQPDLRTKNTGQGGGSSYQHPHTGEQVPSVTSISGLIDKSGYLGPWHASLAAQWAAANMHMLREMNDPDMVFDAIKGGAARMAAEGRDLGSLAHNTIEALCRGQQIEIDPLVKHHVQCWTQWMERYVKRIIWVEETMWSHAHRYAGTGDVLVEFKNGKIALVDYKTGKSVHADAAMQLNALARADVRVSMDGEIPMDKIDELGVLHLPAPVLTPSGRQSVRGAWSYRSVPIREVDWFCFLCLRQAYEWEHNHSKSALGGKQTTPEWEAKS